VFLGARDFLDWQLGQSSAQRQFEAAAPAISLPQAPAIPQTLQPVAAAKPRRPVEPGDTLAKMVIPRLGAQLYVVEGDGTKELRRGPGHMTGTAPPGGDGNCVIAGHRDTHFRVLKDIHQGDDILLQTKSGEFLYRVTSIRVVSPDYTQPLQPTSDAELNLITCYPFFYVGSAPKRFVVQARLAGSVTRTS
jgi:sortase A